MRVARARAGAAGVFPLRLGGQAVAVALGGAEPGGQRMRVVPGDVDHRVVVALGEAGVAPGIARVAPLECVAARAGGGVVGRVVAVAARAVGLGLGHVAGGLHEAAELPHRDLRLPQVEGARDAHGMGGRLVGQLLKPPALQRRVGTGQRVDGLAAAHAEAARRDAHEGHAQRIHPEGRRGRLRLRRAGGQDKRQTDALQSGRGGTDHRKLLGMRKKPV